MPSPPPRPLAFIVVIMAAAALYVVGNGRVSLWDRDEPRYAQTSRQMFQTGDWVVPRFLDKVRTAKPVFIYWCQASAMAVLGDQGERGAFAARLPSAIAMTLVLAILAVAVSRAADRERAFWTVFIFASCVLTLWSAKACTTDAVLLVGILVAQLCLYAIWRGHATWPVIIVLAIAIAQAGLTKGPVVLGVMGMTLLVLGVFRFFDRRAERRGFSISPSPLYSGERVGERGLSDLKSHISDFKTPSPQPSPRSTGAREPVALGIGGVVARAVVAVVLIAALVAPWLYLVRQRESAFLGTSVSHDVFKRIAQPLEGHTGPPGYHLGVAFATFLPWSLLLPMAIVLGWKNRAQPQICFALAAVLGPWVMFEIVQTKLPHYMLPAYAPLAFLTADAIVRCLRGEKDDLTRKPFLIGTAIVGAILVAIGAFTVYLARRFHDPVTPAIALTCVALIAAACFVTLFARHKPRLGLITMGVGMAAFYAALFAVYLPSANSLRLSMRVAEILRQQGATGEGQAVMLDYKEPTLAFYQGGTIRENSAMTLSDEVVNTAPPWLVVTREVWEKSSTDVRSRLEIVDSAKGLAYADGGRTVEVLVLRKR